MTRTVAIVGATGAVGRDLRRQLERRAFPADEVVFLASERSRGVRLPFLSRDVEVRVLGESGDTDGVDVALFSAGGGTSKEHAPRFVDAGALVVDNSSAWRMDPDVPLVVTEVNAHTLDERPRKGIVANPNCTTMVAMLPLKALHDAFGLEGFVATSFQAAGGAGQKGIDELASQVAPLASDVDRLVSDGATALGVVPPPKIHADVLAFNVVPLLGTLGDGGYTDEELKLQNESRKILGLPQIWVAPTCVRVPVMVGHSIAVRATFRDPITVEAARAAMDGFPGMVLDPAPTPLAYAGRDEVAVGRVRADLTDPRTLSFFVVGDNLLKGAALNTVQIAEHLVARGHV